MKSNKWLYFWLSGIQTWDKTEKPDVSKNCIPFNKKLTVIKAPSETGKSVFIKVLRRCINPEAYTADDKRILIRRGVKEGIAVIMTENGNVKFTLFDLKFTCELSVKGEKKKVFNNFVPNEVLDFLGLVLIPGTRRILNLIDQEETKLLSSSNDSYTSSLLYLYTRDKEIEEFIVKSRNELSSVDIKVREKNSQLRDTLIDLSRIKTADVDIEESERDFEEMKSLDNSIKKLLKVKEYLKILTKEIPYKELDLRIITSDLSYLEKVVKINEYLQVLTNNMRANKDSRIIYSKDIENDLKNIKIYSDIQEKIVHLRNSLLDYNKVKSLKHNITGIKDMEAYLNNLNWLHSIVSNLIKLENNLTLNKQLKEEMVITDSLFKGLAEDLEWFKKWGNMAYNLAFTFNSEKDTKNLKEELTTINQELNTVKSILKVCPTCGSSLIGGDALYECDKASK